MLCDAPSFEEAFLTGSFDTETGALSSTGTVHPKMTEIEEIYHSLYYGASKFLDQLGIRKMTIGLSGGIDSAVTAAFMCTSWARKMCFSSTCHHALIRASPRALPKRWQALGTHYAVIPIEESVSPHGKAVAIRNHS